MPILTTGKNRGFTLVEMSIVLVIIGLIIGGILKGQEVIASARQKAVINQVNAVKSATNTYFDRYRALPGDDPQATNIYAGLNNGNGNGVVGTSASGAAALAGVELTTAESENYNFFNALVAANLLNGAQATSVTIPTLQFGSTALPAAPITGAGLTVANGPVGSGGQQRTTHWLRLHKNPGAPAAAVSPRTLANIDTQIDDGLPQGGGVRGDDGTNCNTAAYVASDNIACVSLFEVTQ